MAHTTGDWIMAHGDESTVNIYAPNPQQTLAVTLIAKVSTWPHDTDGVEGHDNARLIAAAPELLAALRDAKLAIVAQMATCHPSNTIFWGERHGRAIAAIDKATGSEATNG